MLDNVTSRLDNKREMINIHQIIYLLLFREGYSSATSFPRFGFGTRGAHSWWRQ